jgi:hypothetical protein
VSPPKHWCGGLERNGVKENPYFVNEDWSNSDHGSQKLGGTNATGVSLDGQTIVTELDVSSCGPNLGFKLERETNHFHCLHWQTGVLWSDLLFSGCWRPISYFSQYKWALAWCHSRLWRHTSWNLWIPYLATTCKRASELIMCVCRHIYLSYYCQCQMCRGCFLHAQKTDIGEWRMSWRMISPIMMVN